MAGLKQIKSKIRSVEKTQTVTKAMEAVSAAKMRKAQQTALAGRTYARAAVSVLARVSAAASQMQHPLLRNAQVGALALPHSAMSPDTSARRPAAEGVMAPGVDKILYIVITSDKGLAGALNSAVLRRVSEDIASNNYTHEQVSIVAVGKKANDFFSARGYTIELYHPNNTDFTSELMQALVDEAANRFALGVVDVVRIAYQQFVSTFEQRPTLHTVFPLSIDELAAAASNLSKVTEPVTLAGTPYTIEPSAEEVLSAIVPRLASVMIYHALLESQASEHSARMVAMKSASDKAEELEHFLTLQFNKARQAAITREVSEITGGMEAMAS